MNRVNRVSVIIEMENARTLCWGIVGRLFAELAPQIEAYRELRGDGFAAEVIIVCEGTAEDAEELSDAIRSASPELATASDLSFESVPGGRYFELKNRGIRASTGDVVILLDSDIVPEKNWLSSLLAPFEAGEAVVVNGHTHLGHDSFLSRTLALTWCFPLRDHDARFANRRALNANNCAFAGDWIRRQPFTIDNGFKVSCSELMNRFFASGGEMVRVPAYAQHAPLAGWRFLAWRAAVTGRDADRKTHRFKNASRSERFIAALKFWLKMELRVLRRVLGHWRKVEMPVWELPAALSVGFAFYLISLANQLAATFGFTSDQPEDIPAYAEHH